MILQALCAYYEALAARDEIVRVGYGKENVSYALSISWEGELRRVISLKHEENRGKKKVFVPERMTVSERATRGVNIVPYFLCDKSAFFLGVDDKGNAKRTAESFQAAKALHQGLLSGVDDPGARAICAFFERWNPEEAKSNPALADAYEEVQEGAMLIFFLPDGTYAHERPAIDTVFSAYALAQADTGGERMRCLVTGEEGQPIALAHNKIKGIYGGQAMGLSLVSFNQNAFCSYGNEDSKRALNAPVGSYAAFAYTTALNQLLANSERKKRLGDMTVVFWAKSAEAGYEDLFAITSDPQPSDEQKMSAILSCVQAGLPIDWGTLQPKMPFYILGLSPNAGRAAVRLFLNGEFGDMIEHVMKHYARLQIAHAPYEPQFLPPYALLRETANPNERTPTPPAPLAGALMRSIWLNDAYPEALLSMILLRIRAEHEVTYAKAAMLKAYMIQNKGKSEEEIGVSLNENCVNRAYLLGRLFAVLEKAQQDANPGINTTIKDRYFASASSTPAAVFPTLIRLSRSHIAKAEYGKANEIAMSKILDMLPAEPLPTRMTLEEEGMFYLGYYHQNQARYQKKDTEEVK